jgi:hypothetical protein
MGKEGSTIALCTDDNFRVLGSSVQGVPSPTHGCIDWMPASVAAGIFNGLYSFNQNNPQTDLISTCLIINATCNFTSFKSFLHILGSMRL